MCWRKKIVDEWDIQSLDELVQLRFANETGEEIALLSVCVEDAEEVVKEIQTAIKEAKKSEWYEPKEG